MYYILYNLQSKDITGTIVTDDSIDNLGNDKNIPVEINEEIYKKIKQNKSGAYYDNGVQLKPAKSTKYDKWDYVNKQWVLDADLQLWGETIEVRNQRDFLLVEMDEIVSNPLRWATFSPELQAQWVQYRLDLLNVPQQSGFPLNVVFPTKPSV